MALKQTAPALRAITLATLMVVVAGTSQSQTVSMNGTNYSRQASSLYYRLGGSNPGSMAANSNALNLRLGLSGNARVNYSCGKFDIGAALGNYMTEFAALGSTLQAAVTAAILALPMYLMQRAQPGLYKLFRDFSDTANINIAAALKSCEELEDAAKRDPSGNPYDSYVALARGEGWKQQMSLGSDVVASKGAAGRNGSEAGLTVFQGMPRGGVNQAPLRVVDDTLSVGYKAMMNQLPASSSDTVFPATTRLGRLWPTPRAAAAWAVSVLGDQEVATCDAAACGNQDGGVGKSVATGLGLAPKYEAAMVQAESEMTAVVNGGTNPTFAELSTLTSPGVIITREIIDAIRRQPAEMRSVLIQYFAGGLAMSRTIERALAVRDMLQTGMTAANYAQPIEDVRKRVGQLNTYIEGLLFEQRVRKELVSNTAGLLLDFDRMTSVARSANVPAGQEATPAPLTGGRVTP